MRRQKFKMVHLIRGVGGSGGPPTVCWNWFYADIHSLCFISNTVNEGLVSHFLRFHSRCLAVAYFPPKSRLVLLLNLFSWYSYCLFFCRWSTKKNCTYAGNIYNWIIFVTKSKCLSHKIFCYLLPTFCCFLCKPELNDSRQFHGFLKFNSRK